MILKSSLPYHLVIMLAIDFPGKKRIFMLNNTTREMIADIFKKNGLSKLTKISSSFLSSGKSLKIIPQENELK